MFAKSQNPSKLAQIKDAESQECNVDQMNVALCENVPSQWHDMAG